MAGWWVLGVVGVYILQLVPMTSTADTEAIKDKADNPDESIPEHGGGVDHDGGDRGNGGGTLLRPPRQPGLSNLVMPRGPFNRGGTHTQLDVGRQHHRGGHHASNVARWLPARHRSDDRCTMAVSRGSEEEHGSNAGDPGDLGFGGWSLAGPYQGEWKVEAHVVLRESDQGSATTAPSRCHEVREGDRSHAVHDGCGGGVREDVLRTSAELLQNSTRGAMNAWRSTAPRARHKSESQQLQQKLHKMGECSNNASQLRPRLVHWRRRH